MNIDESSGSLLVFGIQLVAVEIAARKPDYHDLPGTGCVVGFVSTFNPDAVRLRISG